MENINSNIIHLKPSATLAINERSNALLKEGKEIFKLGFGQSPFPVPDCVVAALKANAHQKDYLPVRGLETLRVAVANYHRRKLGIDCSREDVLIGPGSKELLFLTQMIYSGDLLLPRPSWVSYEPQAQLANKQHHWLLTKAENGYMLDASTLADYCQKHQVQSALLILNYPSNPTGSSFAEDQLQAIAKVARQYNLLILSDEIYGDVHHGGQHQSIAKFYPERTIISGGLSKWCGAGGWRLGTFVFPPNLQWLVNKIAIAASETFTTTSAPIQYAAVKAFEGDAEIDQYLTNSRTILKRIGQTFAAALNRHSISTSKPIGGFYLMPDFKYYQSQLTKRHILTSQQLCERLLEETGVALLPLSDFGMNPTFLGARLSYVDFDGQRALEMIEKNSAITAEQLAPKVMAGIKKIVRWLK
ncbi:MAG: aminotransferase class I/II-fold pyridoxal phosphate-dependent enzyme [Bacteroidota bacterium]